MAERLLHRYGDRDTFIRTFNPDLQSYAAQYPERSYFGDAPTLSTLNAAYGNRSSVMWLLPQLSNLEEYCGCKDKMTVAMKINLADVITTEWGYLKTSELLLFFHKFKTGAYGRFYGSVDPMVITTAMQDFIADRSMAYAKHEREIERERREKENEGAITYEEYQKLKEQYRQKALAL